MMIAIDLIVAFIAGIMELIDETIVERYAMSNLTSFKSRTSAIYQLIKIAFTVV